MGQNTDVWQAGDAQETDFTDITVKSSRAYFKNRDSPHANGLHRRGRVGINVFETGGNREVRFIGAVHGRTGGLAKRLLLKFQDNGGVHRNEECRVASRLL